MKRFSIILMCLCALVMSVSAANNEIVGKWKQEMSQNGMSATCIYDFAANGQMSQWTSMTGQQPKMKMEATITSTYKYEGGVLTYTISADNVNIDVFEVEGVPDSLIGMAMSQVKSQLGNNVEQKVTDVKIEGNTLTGTLNGQAIELTRID